MKHIIYIPGLGDRYDGIRRLGLRLWRRPDVVVSHVPMHWLNPEETFDQKIDRIKTRIDLYPGSDVVLVGESAGGAASIVAMDRFRRHITQLVTICGMNHGASNVNPKLYQKNRAFKEAMLEADSIMQRMSPETKTKMLTVYSSNDFTVRPKNSLINGVEAVDLKTPGHMVAILAVLFGRFKTIKYIASPDKH